MRTEEKRSRERVEKDRRSRLDFFEKNQSCCDECFSRKWEAFLEERNRQRHFTGDPVLDALLTEGDRLTRAAVDACIERGEDIIPWLEDIVQDEGLWNLSEEDPLSWSPFHALAILGGIGTPAVVEPLLHGLLLACDTDHDELVGILPAIFGAVGSPATIALEELVDDDSEDWYPRAMACDALTAIALRHDGAADDIHDFLASIMEDAPVAWDVRMSAASSLLHCTPERHHDSLLNFLRDCEERAVEDDDPALFDEDDVRLVYAFAEERLDRRAFFVKNWLQRYHPEEILERERWRRRAKRNAQWHWRLWFLLIGPLRNYLENRRYAQWSKTYVEERRQKLAMLNERERNANGQSERMQ